MQNNPRRRRRHLGVSVCALCIGLVAASASGVIVDNVDPGFTVLSGSWSLYAAVGSWGDNYRFKQTNEAAVTGEVEWRPNLPEAGVFTVWVWYRASETARPNNARYTVYYDGGNQAVYVNQQVNGSRWVELGSYPFAAGTAGRVTLVDQAQAGRNVVADAVRFDIPQIRAFWADVFHYGLQTAEQIDTMIARAVEGNYNVIIPEVLAFHDNEVGSHGAYWRSYIVARSVYVTDYFDPLAYMVQQAHAHGLEIHPWLVAYRLSSTWPPPGNAYLAAHPEWLMVPRGAMGGGPAKVDGYYTFDPGNPEVQEYLVSIVKELVTNYAIDGVHWDYIRYTSADAGYPADAIATNSGLARFRRLKGRTDTPAATGDKQWDDFRRRTITELIRRCRAEIPAITNPRQPLRHSASLITWGDAPAEFEGSSAYARFQNWAEWMERGYLDTAVPMCYFREYLADQQQWYRNWVDAAMGWRYSREMVIGPGIYMNAMADSITQLQYARDAGADGVSTYSYDVTSKDGDGPAWYPYVATNLFTSAVGMPIMPWRDSATATEGTLYGRITDYYTGNPVDGATVQVGALDPVKADGNGYYVVTMIPAAWPGTSYDVFVGAGEEPVVLPNVTIVPGQLQRQDAAVELGVMIIVDDLDPGFSFLSGQWSDYNLSGQWASSYRLCSTSTSVTGEAEWRPELPAAGLWDVSVWYRPNPSNRASDARYTVHHLGGATDVYVDQKINGAQWVPVGAYEFAAGTSGRVTLVNQSNDSGVEVCADAVRFETGKSVPIESALLTMAVSPAGFGTTEPAVGGPYPHEPGDVVPIEAAALRPGTVFDHWEVSAGAPVADPNSPSTTVTMDTSKTVTAVFNAPTPPEFRAFWADVFHYGLQNASQIDQMIALAVQGNYNVIIPEVLAFHDNQVGSHGAYWRSNLVARSVYVTESFDPLAYMCEQAHANGLELHPWLVAFRVCSTWPPPGNAYLAAHPEWLKVPKAAIGTIAKIGSYYEFDPGSPDVQDYLAAVVRELVTDYPIDGIHWDYIRSTAQDSGYPSDLNYQYSGLKRFQRIYNRTDVPNATGDTQWDDFRRRSITELVRRIRWEIPLITSNPRQPVRYSASVVTWYPCSTNFHNTRPYYEVYSDWEYWQSEGYLDCPVLMAYFDEDGSYPTTYRAWVDNTVNLWRYNRQVVIGPGIYMNSFANSITQLLYARNAGADGLSTYSYGTTSDTGTTWTDWYPYVAANLFTAPAPVPSMPWRDPATATEGTLFGQVIDRGTGEPVDDATVEVDTVGAVQTDGNGYYIVTMIPATAAGTVYDVTASKTGLTPETHVGVAVVAGDVRRDDLMIGELPGVLADFDGDDDVDMTDFALFQICFNGPNRPPADDDCDAPDLDGDGDVDLTDFGVFQGCFNGPNRAPACAP